MCLTYIFVMFLFSTLISLLLPQRLVALPVPCSIILIYALDTYAIHILESLTGLSAFSFPDLGLWVSSNLLNFFFLANSIPPLVCCLSLCLTHAQQITLVLWRWSVLNCSVELHQQIERFKAKGLLFSWTHFNIQHWKPIGWQRFLTAGALGITV